MEGDSNKILTHWIQQGENWDPCNNHPFRGKSGKYNSSPFIKLELPGSEN